jgi:hypothetical protein
MLPENTLEKLNLREDKMVNTKIIWKEEDH